MARPPRLDVIFQRHSAPIWFVTLNTDLREPWLNDAGVHSALRDFAARGFDAGRAVVGRYVLMPDHLLRKSDSYAQKWDCVRMNPVRAGLVVQPEDWPLQGEFYPIYFD